MTSIDVGLMVQSHFLSIQESLAALCHQGDSDTLYTPRGHPQRHRNSSTCEGRAHSDVSQCPTEAHLHHALQTDMNYVVSGQVETQPGALHM